MSAETPQSLTRQDYLNLQPRAEYAWTYEPFKFSVGRQPHNPIQEEILAKLTAGLTSPELGNELVNLPRFAFLGREMPKMAIAFGQNTIFEENREGLRDYIRIKKPRPLLFLIDTVDKLPEKIDFDLARGVLVRGTSHNGAIFEVTKEEGIKRVLWASTQGNYAVIEGPETQIMQDVIFRILAHYGATFVTQKQDARVSDGQILRWQDWRDAATHQATWEAAQILAQRKLIEDHVILEKYASPEHIRLIRLALDRSALGESMRGEWLSGLGVYVVTPSGGGKVDWNPDPEKGVLVPVSHLTPEGYSVITPLGMVDVVPNHKFVAGSVETHENLMVTTAFQLAQAGITPSYPAYMDWYNRHMRNERRVPVKQTNMRSGLVIDHVHVHPEPGSVNSNILSLVRPDPRFFPDIDLPCGSLQAASALVSALEQDENFSTPGPEDHPLREKVVAAVLPGHGMVFVGENRQAVTHAILHGMKAKEPKWV